MFSMQPVYDESAASRAGSWGRSAYLRIDVKPHQAMVEAQLFTSGDIAQRDR